MRHVDNLYGIESAGFHDGLLSLGHEPDEPIGSFLLALLPVGTLGCLACLFLLNPQNPNLVCCFLVNREGSPRVNESLYEWGMWKGPLLLGTRQMNLMP